MPFKSEFDPEKMLGPDDVPRRWRVFKQITKPLTLDPEFEEVFEALPEVPEDQSQRNREKFAEYLRERRAAMQ